MRAATKEELAYCAGVIDSDGAIMMQIMKDPAARKTTRYRSVVSLGQIQRGAVDLFSEIFGGNVFKRVNQSGKSYIKNVRPMFHWSVSHMHAAACLRQMLPYFRIKRSQAELAILAADVVSTSKHGAKPRPQSTLDNLEKMWLAMKKMNSWDEVVPFAVVAREVSGPSPQQVLFKDDVA
jgi:hypothetical protein